MGIKEAWGILPANKKKLLVMIGAGIPFLFVLYLIFSGEDRPQFTQTNPDEIETNILTGSSTKKIGIDALAKRQKDYEKSITTVDDQLKSLKSRMEVAEKQENDKFERLNQRLDEILRAQQDNLTSGGGRGDRRTSLQTRKQSDSMTEALNILEQNKSGQSENQTTPQTGGQNNNSTQGRQQGNNSSSVISPSSGTWDIFRDPDQAKTGRPSIGGSDGNKTASSVKSQIKEYVQEVTVAEEGPDPQDVYIPATTIVTGVLINGIDAPTSKSSSKDPHPALVRIKHDAILPNHFTVDVKECFVIVSGFGELSAERAHLRGETISCVRNDGGVIETKFQAYAVGEDSKEGLRGRLVSKQGSIIAKAMLAGFAGGLSDIFRPTAINGLQTDPSSTLTFQTPSFGEASKAAGFAGFSNAMERLADYYVDLAEEVFPVIEVNGGRRVGLVMTKGITLKLKGSTTGTKLADNGSSF